MRVRTTLFLGLLSFSAATSTLLATNFVVRVNAGARARNAVPVSVDVPLETSEGQIALVYGSGITFGQVDDLGSGRARVSWILEHLDEKATAELSIKITDAVQAPAGFDWLVSSGEHGTSTDLVIGERPVLRYMHTAFDPENIELTKKVFHHVFSPDGSRLITKGPGGLYPHHRGIYFGYNKCKVPGVPGHLDTWHAHKGEHQIHRGESRSVGGPVVGGHVVKLHWNDREAKPFVEESRTLLAFAQPEGTALIEFRSELRPMRGPVSLSGDRQHAGVQFRAAQYVAEHQKETRYLRPAKWQALPEDQQINTAEHKDLPWNAIRVHVGDQAFTIAYFSAPENPEGAEFSERLYGRFGEYFPFELTERSPLRVRYRWWIVASHDVTRESIQAKYDDFADPPNVELVP